jgi:hypothetical protein
MTPLMGDSRLLKEERECGSTSPLAKLLGFLEESIEVVV